MKVDISTDPRRGKVITLLEPLAIVVGRAPHTIPAGFESDGMSVPRLLWPFLSPAIAPATIRAAVGHDWLYESHVCTRMQADAWMREQLICDSFGTAKAWIAWLGVRIGGWSHW